MKHFLCCLIALGVMLPNLAMAQDRSLELIQKAASGKEGAYEVMLEFARCSGFYQAMGEYGDQVQMEGAKELAEGLKKHSSDAAIVAVYFWAPHSQEPIPAVWEVANTARQQYLSLLQEDRDRQAVSKMTKECKSTIGLHVQIMKAINEG